MWFDARAKLAEIVAPPCDIRDTGRQFSNYCVAVVAVVATPPRERQNPSPAPKPSGMAYLSREKQRQGRAAS